MYGFIFIVNFRLQYCNIIHIEGVVGNEEVFICMW